MTECKEKVRYRLAWISGLAVTLSACAAGPDYRAPQPAALGVPAAYSQGEGAALDPADLAQWWTRLNDPTLSALIDQAIANNLDIVQAQARLRQARESLVQANASLLPQLSGSATGGRNYSSQDAGGRLDANGNPIGGSRITGSGSDVSRAYCSGQSARLGPLRVDVDP